MLEERIYISGILCFKNSFHIGSGNVSMETDSLLFRDAAGEIVIPGTSMCGALKNYLSTNYKSQKNIIDKYFGNSSDKHISRVFVEDLYPFDKNRKLMSRVRDGVAIRRDYGSARKGAKYDYEISERGARLSFTMMVEFRENDHDAGDMKQLLKTLLNDLQNERTWVGGNKTRGLGRCKLKDIQIKKIKFREDLKDFLKYGLENTGENIAEIHQISQKDILNRETNSLEINIQCKITEPLLVKDGLRSGGDTFVETITQKNTQQKKETDAYFVKIINSNGNEDRVIPGGSIKGVFRTRAEKIIRTLGEDACDPTAPDNINVCDQNIKKALEELKHQSETEAQAEEKLSVERFNKLIKNSCFTCRLFGNKHLASKLIFSDSKIDNASTKKFDGVAINRFTSGPVDGALFDAMPLIKGEFTINITAQNTTDLETALLIFVLRDFKDQAVPISIGFGKNKGYGICRNAEININGSEYNRYISHCAENNIFNNWRKYWEKKDREKSEAI